MPGLIEGNNTNILGFFVGEFLVTIVARILFGSVGHSMRRKNGRCTQTTFWGNCYSTTKRELKAKAFGSLAASGLRDAAPGRKAASIMF